MALVTVAVVADDRPYSYRPPQARPDHESSEESFEDAKYNFNWQVDEDDNNFGHQEERDGDETQGSYTVELPDGRRQTVTYHVDGDSGFVAEVSYSGEARYSEESESREAPRPAYQAPRRRDDSDESHEAPRNSYKAPRRS